MSGSSGVARTFTFLVPKYSNNLEERCTTFPIYMGKGERETELYNVTSSFMFVHDNGAELSAQEQLQLIIKSNMSVRSS
jgi:hypothetical protein